LGADVEEGKEVVDCLGKDTRPVYRVDGTEIMLCVEFFVGEERLDDVLLRAVSDRLTITSSGTIYLTIIEGTLYCNIVDIWVSDCGHLRFLDGRNTALGVENED
jgi:hypothetical protein